VKPFTDKQTQLVAIFANQALIEPLFGERRRTGVQIASPKPGADALNIGENQYG
jgi:hypothetical protein